MYTGFLEERHIEMEDFDNLSITHAARAELERIKEPHRRRILENFIEHAEAETTGNYEALIESCSAKSQTYAVYGCNEFQKSIQPQDVESMKEFYHMLVASNVYLIHGEVEKLIVGDDSLYVELMLHQLYPGEIIPAAFGFGLFQNCSGTFLGSSLRSCSGRVSPSVQECSPQPLPSSSNTNTVATRCVNW